MQMMRLFLVLTCLHLVFGARILRACDLALVLAVDVSGSVDIDEYRIQMDGLAAALRDGIIAEALVRGGARVAVIQWSGSGRQELSLPWVAISDFSVVDRLSNEIAGGA